MVRKLRGWFWCFKLTAAKILGSVQELNYFFQSHKAHVFESKKKKKIKQYLIKQLVLGQITQTFSLILGGINKNTRLKKKTQKINKSVLTQSEQQICTYLIWNKPIDEFIHREQRLWPLLVRVPRSDFDWNGPTAGHWPQVVYAAQEVRKKRRTIKSGIKIFSKKKKKISYFSQGV